jgi:Carboxypeptidase regulatory-like domain/TonB dependent receptor/TonB-dependent Receptor Plug Domain
MSKCEKCAQSMSQRILGLPAICLLLPLLCASLCSAQVFTANVSGLVTDPSGAAVPSALVRLRNTDTNDARTTTSGSDGRYTFSQLSPGTYEISVEAKGFRSFLEPQLTLNASQAAEFNIPLTLGDSSQRVEVAAVAPVLDTQSADKSVTLSGQAVVNLPTSVRNPLVLVWQTAGVVAIRTGISTNVNEQNQNRFSLNGGRDESAAILIDGVPSTAGDWGGALATPSIEAVQEVQVLRNSYDVQYGRTDGGVVSMVTKGGSSKFHGNAYDYLRNSLLDANSWDRNRAGLPKAQFQRNQFGGALGGPIMNSKHLYFFGDFEELRDSTPGSFLSSVPTALERKGDFSQSYNGNGSLSVIYNPFSTSYNAATNTYSRMPFAANMIPANLLDPVGLKTTSLYPLPNLPGSAFTHALNYAAGGKNIDINKRFDARVDWAKSEHFSMFTRVTKAWEDTLAPAYLGNNIDSNYGGHNPRHQVVIASTWVPTPTWVTNILIGTGRWREVQLSPSQGLNATALGFSPSLANQLSAQTIPQFTVSNYAQISNSRYLSDPRITNNLQINNSKQLGNHGLKFGFIIEAQQVNSTDVNSANFSFTRGMTSGPTAATDSTTSGNAVASLLLGTGASGSAPNAARLALTEKYLAWYLEDSWKLGRLTLNYGLRYEIQNAATERYNRLNNFAYNAVNPLSQPTGLNLRGGLEFLNNSNRGLWDTRYGNFAPRLGLSFKVSDKLVVRAGYGIFYTPAWAGALAADGYSVSTPWVSSVGGGGLVPQDLLSNPFPNFVQPVGSSLGLSTLVGQGVNAFVRSHPTPYVQSYSIDFQYQVTPASVVEIGYSGVQGRKLFYGYGLNANQLDPQYLSLGAALNRPAANPFFGIITTGSLAGRTIPSYQLLLPFPEFTSVNLSGLTPGASSSYNALTFKFSRRFSAGLQALVTYQYSKAIDNASETQSWEISDAQRNVYNLSNERSISGHDIPQAFTASVTYELPFGRGRKFGAGMNRAVDAIAGGWQVATTVRAGSGLPLQFTANNTLSNYGYSVARPNITNLVDLTSGTRSPDHWFNTTAVSAPAPYTIGTAPRWISNLRTGPLNSTDLSLMKNFQLTEAWKMQFQAQAFNLTNTPQYGRANTTVGSTTFGVITGTTYVTPRNIQLALRLLF